MNSQDFEKYLNERIKVGGKTNNSGQGEEQDLPDLHHRLLQQVPQVPHQEVLEEEQPEGLAARGRQRQGLLRAPLLPDQQRGRRGRRGRRISSRSFSNRQHSCL